MNVACNKTKNKEKKKKFLNTTCDLCVLILYMQTPLKCSFSVWCGVKRKTARNSGSTSPS